MENITNLTEEEIVTEDMENTENMENEITEGENEMEEMVITFEEEVTETKGNKVKQFVTNDKVQVATASAAISGIVGFALGKAHGMKVQKELLGRVTTIIESAYTAIMQGIDNEDGTIHASINELVTGDANEEPIIELKESQETLKTTSKLIIEQIEKLSKTSKFNVFAKRQVTHWVDINKKLLALITAIQYQEISYQQIIAQQHNENKNQ